MEFMTCHNIIISPHRLTLTHLRNDVQDDEKYAKWEKEEMPGIVSGFVFCLVVCILKKTVNLYHMSFSLSSAS